MQNQSAFLFYKINITWRFVTTSMNEWTFSRHTRRSIYTVIELFVYTYLISFIIELFGVIIQQSCSWFLAPQEFTRVTFVNRDSCRKSPKRLQQVVDAEEVYISRLIWRVFVIIYQMPFVAYTLEIVWAITNRVICSHKSTATDIFKPVTHAWQPRASLQWRKAD